MPPPNQLTGQLKEMAAGLSGKQRAILLGGALLTAALLIVFVKLIGKPEMKPLYTNMEPADAQALAARLSEKRIPNEISTDGKTVSVPADQLDAARLEMASREMPRSGRLGFELFDKLSWGQTEFDEKVNYQRALEGELERTIQTLKDVESVRVHLVMPADSLFLDRERSAKASVILNLRGRMNPEMQLAIARLVSGAVDRLSPESVTVIDANNNRSASLPRQDPFSPTGTSTRNWHHASARRSSPFSGLIAYAPASTWTTTPAAARRTRRPTIPKRRWRFRRSARRSRSAAAWRAVSLEQRAMCPMLAGMRRWRRSPEKARRSHTAIAALMR